MAERQLTLIDVDENPFVVRFKEDRIQLAVIDSRPELEAGELRALSAVLYAAYGAGPVLGRLDAARARLVAMRDKLALAGGLDEVVGALDGALCAIADARHDIVAPWAAIGPCAEPPASAPTPPEIVALASRRRKLRGIHGRAAGGRGRAATSSRVP